MACTITAQNVTDARSLFQHVEMGLALADRATLEQRLPDMVAIFDALKSVGADTAEKVTEQTLSQALDKTGKTTADLKLKSGGCPFAHQMPDLPKD